MSLAANCRVVSPLVTCFVLYAGIPTSAALVTSADALRVAGTTHSFNGSHFNFLEGNTTNPRPKYSFSAPTGPNLEHYSVTILPSDQRANGDFFFVGSTSQTPLLVNEFRYAEVAYHLSDDFAGNHQLFLRTSNEGFGRVEFSTNGIIPTTTGDHRILIDLSTNTDINGIGYSGNLTLFRWDFFNVADNGSNSFNDGKSFTLKEVTFGTEIASPVPEPASLFLACMGLIALYVAWYGRHRLRSC